MPVITNIEDLRRMAEQARAAHVLRLRRFRLLDRKHLPRQRARLPGDQAAPARAGRTSRTAAPRRRWSASTWRCRWRSRPPASPACSTPTARSSRRGRPSGSASRSRCRTMSICSIEDVAAHTKAPFWFQLYVMRDRDFIERLIDRAKAARCGALVLTRRPADPRPAPQGHQERPVGAAEADARQHRRT